MDLNKIRQKLDTLNRQGQGSGTKVIWKPEEGSQVIRIVPYMHDRDWPFQELLFYYDLAKRTIISPQNFGNPDPIQEKADALKATGEKEDWLFARKIEPKMRTYVPVLVRGKEEEGVKMWGFGKTVYEELLKTIDDPDYGDITDLKQGRDITVDYERPKDGYPKTNFRVKPNTTPATTNKAVVKLLEEMPSIQDIWEAPSYQELESLFEAFLNNQGDDIDDTPPPSQSAPSDFNANSDNAVDSTSDSNQSPKGVAATADIDSAFDDMFS